MLEIKCPYSDIVMKLALLSLDSKMEDESLGERLYKRLSEIYSLTKSEINKAIAEDNGIQVIDLINSPNYTNLVAEYSKNRINKTLDILKEEGFSDKEAWAFVLAGSGNITF